MKTEQNALLVRNSKTQNIFDKWIHKADYAHEMCLGGSHLIREESKLVNL